MRDQMLRNSMAMLLVIYIFNTKKSYEEKSADRPGSQRVGRERQMSVDKLLCFFIAEGMEVIDVQLSFSRTLKHKTAVNVKRY